MEIAELASRSGRFSQLVYDSSVAVIHHIQLLGKGESVAFIDYTGVKDAMPMQNPSDYVQICNGSATPTSLPNRDPPLKILIPIPNPAFIFAYKSVSRIP